MRSILIVVFALILLGMLVVTTRASLDTAIWDVSPEVLGDLWFQATLADAYFGFLTFYVWVAYKEQSWLARIGWVVLVLTLGNIAMSIYVLVQLFKLPADAPLRDLLLAKS